MARVPVAARPARLSAERLPVLRAVPYRKTPADGPFAALPWAQRKAAEQWYWKFCQRWGNDLPPWRRAILAGVAKRLAVNPPDPSKFRKMLTARGGYALARKCQLEGIPHPGVEATRLRWRRVLGARPQAG